MKVSKVLRNIARVLPVASLIEHCASEFDEGRHSSYKKFEAMTLVHTFYMSAAIVLGIGALYNNFKSEPSIWCDHEEVIDYKQIARKHRHALETKLFKDPAYANKNGNLIIEPEEKVDAYKRMGITNTSQEPTISQLEKAIKSYEAER